MFKSQPAHASSPTRRVAPLLMVCSAAMIVGACAHNPGDIPELQWQLSTVSDAPSHALLNAAAEPQPPQSGCPKVEDGGREGGCYVYRGGRDPRTGLAYTQL